MKQIDTSLRLHKMYTCNTLLFLNISVYAFITLNIHFFCVSGNFKGLRIFQGRDAKRGEFPYAVALSLKSSYPESTFYETFTPFCTGSIITPVWVLTAGHCIVAVQIYIHPPNNPSPSAQVQKPVIQYVSPLDNYNWTSSNVIRTILHPNFKLTKDYVVNDIGLVKVQNTTVTAYGKISSVDFGSIYGHKVFSLGLGRMKSESGQIGDAIKLNKPLQVYDATVVKCGRIKDMLGSSSFCLAWNCNKPSTSCTGDSGGPIIHPSGIVAVTTGGDSRHCNTTEKSLVANIVTPVSPYVDWIARSIRGT